MKRMGLVVGLVMGLSGTAFAAENHTNATVNGVTAVEAVAIPVGVHLAVQGGATASAVIGAILMGTVLEAQSDCAAHGLVNHVQQNTQTGNGGYIGQSRQVSEERVKWEAAPNGWMQRKCD